jgi:GNAT superfamily N-acetyltransferase
MRPGPTAPDPELEALIAEEEEIEAAPRRFRAESMTFATTRASPEDYLVVDSLSEVQESIYRTVTAGPQNARDPRNGPRISRAVLDEVRNAGWSPPVDMEYIEARPRQERTNTPNVNYQFLNATTHPGPYAEYIGKARGFFSTHADRRYSPSTLSRLELVNEAIRYGNDNIARPLLIVADNPITFDPETESKSGGLSGIAVCWPMERTLVAVNRNVREQGIGSTLLEQMAYQVGRAALTLWVGQSNVIGHRFCLTNGFIPTAMNGSGAVRYAVENLDV